jgi:hypothetical protein
LRIHDSVGCGDIFFQRRKRKLNADWVEALGLKKRNNFGPAGAVSPGSVDENYVVDHDERPFS